MKNFTRTQDNFVNNKEVIKFENNKGETIEIWLTRTTADKNYKNDLMNIWLKHGYVNEFITDRITIEVFATDKKGNCYAWYNPQHTLSEDGKRVVLNFNYILEDNTNNRDYLINKVIKLATTTKELNELKSEIIGG